MSALWIPESAEELEAAVEAGTVIETHFQEYKQFGQSDAGKPRVPSSLAKSLAGLAVDGGCLCSALPRARPSSVSGPARSHCSAYVTPSTRSRCKPCRPASGSASASYPVRAAPDTWS